MRWEEVDRDETKRGDRRETDRLGRGKREGKSEPSALSSGWCVWGRCFCLRGLKGGGTGMVERLAVHRPGEKKRTDGGGKRLDIVFKLIQLVVFLCVCLFFLSSTYSD